MFPTSQAACPFIKRIAPKKLEGLIDKVNGLTGKKYVNTMFFYAGSQQNLAKLNAEISGKSKSKRQSMTSASTWMTST